MFKVCSEETIELYHSCVSADEVKDRVIPQLRDVWRSGVITPCFLGIF
jgi:hypothetical protein